MKTSLRKVLMFASSALLMAGTTIGYADGPGSGNGQNAQVRLRTTLAGSAIQGRKPEGNADFRNDGQGRARLNVEVENVNLPSGVVLTVSVVHAGVVMAVGKITLGNG